MTALSPDTMSSIAFSTVILDPAGRVLLTSDLGHPTGTARQDQVLLTAEASVRELVGSPVRLVEAGPCDDGSNGRSRTVLVGWVDAGQVASMGSTHVRWVWLSDLVGEVALWPERFLPGLGRVLAVVSGMPPSHPGPSGHWFCSDAGHAWRGQRAQRARVQQALLRAAELLAPQARRGE